MGQSWEEESVHCGEPHDSHISVFFFFFFFPTSLFCILSLSLELAVNLRIFLPYPFGCCSWKCLLPCLTATSLFNMVPLFATPHFSGEPWSFALLLTSPLLLSANSISCSHWRLILFVPNSCKLWTNKKQHLTIMGVVCGKKYLWSSRTVVELRMSNEFYLFTLSESAKTFVRSQIYYCVLLGLRVNVYSWP